MPRALICLFFAALQSVAQQATVPLVIEGNAPIVELSFPTPSGGVRKAKFLVDTGGGAFGLGSQLAADIGAKPMGPEIKAEGDRFQPLANVTVKLGSMDLDLTGVRVASTPGHVRLGSRNGVEGLLPASLLRKYDVVFDYPGRQFTLAKPGTLTPRGTKIESPIAKDSGFPRLEVRIAGAAYGFLLDTGASFTMISRADLERWSKANPSWPTATGAAGFANMFGGDVENGALMLRIPEWGLGDLTIHKAAAVSREIGTYEKSMSRRMTAPIAGALAGNVLRDFRVQIDYANGVTYFERAGASSDTDQASVGLVLSGPPDTPAVTVTGISSRAASDVKSAVHAGDRLVAVEGVSMIDKPLAVVADALSGNPGAQKRLTLERAGVAVNVTVTVASLL